MGLGHPAHFSNTLQSRCGGSCDSVTNPLIPFYNVSQFQAVHSGAAKLHSERIFSAVKEKLSQWPVPVIKILSDDQMFEVVVNGPLIVLQQCVGVSQAVAGLRFHGLVLQESGQLQSSPEGEKAKSRREAQRMSWVGAHGRLVVSLLYLRPL